MLGAPPLESSQTSVLLLLCTVTTFSTAVSTLTYLMIVEKNKSKCFICHTFMTTSTLRLCWLVHNFWAQIGRLARLFSIYTLAAAAALFEPNVIYSCVCLAIPTQSTVLFAYFHQVDHHNELTVWPQDGK